MEKSPGGGGAVFPRGRLHHQYSAHYVNVHLSYMVGKEQRTQYVTFSMCPFLSVMKEDDGDLDDSSSDDTDEIDSTKETEKEDVPESISKFDVKTKINYFECPSFRFLPRLIKANRVQHFVIVCTL